MWLLPTTHDDALVGVELRWRERTIRLALELLAGHLGRATERSLAEHLLHTNTQPGAIASPELTTWSVRFADAVRHARADVDSLAGEFARVAVSPALRSGWRPHDCPTPTLGCSRVPARDELLLLGEQARALLDFEALEPWSRGELPRGCELATRIGPWVVDGGEPLWTQLLGPGERTCPRPDAAFMAALEQALASIAGVWPELHAELLRVVERVVPFTSPLRRSFTNLATRGVVFVACASEPSLTSLIDRLVHEAAHLRLATIERLHALHREPPLQRVYSPFRGGQRPVGGLLHGLFVFARCVLVLERIGSSESVALAAAHRERLHEALDVVEREVRLTDVGELLIEEITSATELARPRVGVLLSPVSKSRDALRPAMQRRVEWAVPRVLRRFAASEQVLELQRAWACLPSEQRALVLASPRFCFAWQALHRSLAQHEDPRASLLRLRAALEIDISGKATFVAGLELVSADPFVDEFIARLNRAPAVAERDLQTYAPIPKPHKLALARALELIELAWPALGSELREYVQMLVVYESAWLSTFTDGAFFGAVFLSEAYKPFASRRDLAEHIVHEQAHLRMCVLREFVPLISGDPPAVELRSPWRPDLRPIDGLLQSAFAFARVCAFLRHAHAIDPHPWYAERRSELQADLLDVCRTLEHSGTAWLPLGRRLLADVRDEAVRHLQVTT